MDHRVLSIFAVVAAALATGTASAHTGVEHAWGVLHPFSGLDHLLAAVAVGLLAARHAGREVLALPLAFLVAMAAGMALALTGLPLLGVEPALVLSLVALGGIAALGVQLPLAAGMAVLALFAVFHGYAHGSELPTSAMVINYGSGILLGSALLHAAGIMLGRSRQSLIVRGSGAVIGASGLVMLAGI